MTELLQQVIAQIEQLPLDRQDAIAAWLLVQLQNEQNSGIIDTTDHWTKEDRSDVTSFSLQYAASLCPGKI
jgi:hypothetical protein